MRITAQMPSMVSTMRARTVTIVCVALSLVFVAVVLGLSTLADVYTRRQADLAGRMLIYATHAQVTPVDPAGFAEALPRNTVVVFTDRQGSRVVWSTSATAHDALQHLLRRATSESGVFDDRLDGYPVAAQLLNFDAPVSLRDPETGWHATAESALIAVGARSSHKLKLVMAGVAVIVTLTTMAGAAGVTTVVIRSTMRPLTGLAHAVDALGPRPPAGSMPRAADRYRESETLTNAIGDLVDRCARTEHELREFVANTSHELRTPLTKIQGWSELHFQQKASARQTDRAMRSIVEECDRMRAMVDQLTVLAWAEAPPLDAAEHVDVRALCTTVAEDIAVIAPEQEVVLDIPDEPVFVLAHTDRLAQVLRNIVGNSLIHAGDGASIGMRVRCGADDVWVELFDDGCGIAREHQGRLFDRYYSPSRARKSSSGLGLSIARAIVSSYGGAIDLRSEVGRGTTVTLRFRRDHRDT